MGIAVQPSDAAGKTSAQVYPAAVGGLVAAKRGIDDSGREAPGQQRAAVTRGPAVAHFYVGDSAQARRAHVHEPKRVVAEHHARLPVETEAVCTSADRPGQNKIRAGRRQLKNAVDVARVLESRVQGGGIRERGRQDGRSPPARQNHKEPKTKHGFARRHEYILLGRKSDMADAAGGCPRATLCRT